MMKRFFLLSIALVLLCFALSGCSKKLYTEEERNKIHDIIGYVEHEQMVYQRVVEKSLPGYLGPLMAYDKDFRYYISTRNYDPSRPAMALSFDDGPRNVSTNTILDTLEKYGVHATFFMVGENIGEGTQETIDRIRSLGCEIGNHTYDHSYLTSLTEEQIKYEIEHNNELIKQYAGVDCELFRPPGGLVNDTIREIADMPLIYWTIDTRDWESRDAASILSNVRAYKSDGSIVLMHDLYDSTAEAVQTIIPELLDEGYQLMSVSELAYVKGIELEKKSDYYEIAAAEEEAVSE